MLQRNFTPEIVNFVKYLIDGEVLNKPTIDAIIIAAEKNLWPIWLTPYNIRQIAAIEDVDMNSSTDEQISEHIIEKTYNSNWFINTFKRVKEKDYIKKSRILGWINDFLDHLSWYLESYEPKPARKFTPRKTLTNTTKVVALTDLHIWNKNTESILKRLEEILNNLTSSNITHVELFCLWDLVETLVQWWMHDWQIEQMWDTYWFDLLMATVDIFEWMLTSLTDNWISVNFYWLSWNHDRMTKDRDWDRNRLWWLVIYELIKRWLANIEWLHIDILKEYINTIDIWDIRYIVAHWDTANIPKRKWSDIAWNHWDTNKSHNVIMYWHLHNISITEERWITKIWLPWLAWEDFYASKVLDLHSEPWYLEITHNEHWSVDLNIKRLTNE